MRFGTCGLETMRRSTMRGLVWAAAAAFAALAPAADARDSRRAAAIELTDDGYPLVEVAFNGPGRTR